ncbi:MAG: hypothetical protein ACRDPA_21100 [Solirubrobacteraceae bacterium]
MPAWLDRLLPRISIEGEQYFDRQDASSVVLEPVPAARASG